MWHMASVSKCLGAVAGLLLANPVACAELVTVEQPGCYYCQRWNEEVVPACPNTGDGRFALLRRLQLRALPDDIAFARRNSYTPTFLIVEDGRELARPEAYPGGHFSWPMLDDLLADHAGYDPRTGVDG